MEGKKIKLFTGIENDQLGILQIVLYNRAEVKGRDFIVASRLYLEKHYGLQVRVLLSMEGNYTMEYFIWDEILGKPVIIEDILPKKEENNPDCVYMEMVDR